MVFVWVCLIVLRCVGICLLCVGIAAIDSGLLLLTDGVVCVFSFVDLIFNLRYECLRLRVLFCLYRYLVIL